MDISQENKKALAPYSVASAVFPIRAEFLPYGFFV